MTSTQHPLCDEVCHLDYVTPDTGEGFSDSIRVYLPTAPHLHTSKLAGQSDTCLRPFVALKIVVILEALVISSKLLEDSSWLWMLGLTQGHTSQPDHLGHPISGLAGT